MLWRFINVLQKLSWSIRSKIALAFGTIMFCFVLVGAIAIILLLSIKSQQEQENSVNRNLASVQTYKLAFDSETQLYSDQIFINHSQSFSVNTDDNLRHVISDGVYNHNVSTDNADLAFNTALAKQYLKAINDFTTLGNDINASDWTTAENDWHTFSPQFDVVTQLLTQRQTTLESDRDNISSALSSTITSTIMVIGSVIIFCLLLVIFLLFLVERVLVQPINQLQKGWVKVAEGNLDQEIKVPNKDEVGKLAQSFKSALKMLRQVIAGAEISGDLRDLTNKLSVVSQQQATGTNQQLVATTQVATTIAELGRLSEGIAKSTAIVADLSNQSLEQLTKVNEARQISEERTEQMAKVIENSLNNYEVIYNEVSELSRAMTELNEQSETVGSIVKLLNSIAAEVHLLALNATIEAAGAGMYGERFKVVARAVKSLADRANGASQEAQKLITQVQESSREVTQQVIHDQEKINNIINSNSEMRSTLQELLLSFEQLNETITQLQKINNQVSDQAQEIKQATQQQHLSNEQIFSSANSIKQIAEENVNATNLIVSCGSHLDELARQLSSVLNQIVMQN